MSSSPLRLWTPEMTLVFCDLEFDPEQAIFSRDGEQIEYPLGRVISFDRVNIVIPEADIPYWCGDPRHPRCTGRFLRCGPMKDRFPQGLLQIFRENTGNMCWTPGRIKIAT